MRIELPRKAERFGSIVLNDVQRVIELDSGVAAPAEQPGRAIRRIAPGQLAEVRRTMAIVIPVKDERLHLFEGVLTGIPNDVKLIVVSNSGKPTGDQFATETDALKRFCHFANRSALIVHQKHPALAKAFGEAGYTDILDGEGMVRSGKAEGMLVGILLAKLLGSKYVGFIDADNYVPGAVHEYVNLYAAVLTLTQTPYSMVRISWLYKPKVDEEGLYFAKWGRASEVANRYLNELISAVTRFGTDAMRTSCSGEHIMSLPLAETLGLASGFSVEAYEIVNILEQFATRPAEGSPEGRVEIFQVETRNPHFHEDRGAEHLNRMLMAALAAIYHSPLCPAALRAKIWDDLIGRQILASGAEPPKPPTMRPLSSVNLGALVEALQREPPYAEIQHWT